MKQLIGRLKQLRDSMVAKVRDVFASKQGKSFLKVGSNNMNSGMGNPIIIQKVGSNRWTRLKNIVMFPWNYVWHGKAEL
tara:strand:+ start:1423 stop:1659 length:237 start_codon:yes stop_codon:yes gene_type:complete